MELFTDNIEFVFRAINGLDLIDKLQENNSVDILLMDIEMPGMDGITATRVINEKYPLIKIIMLTVFDDEEKIFKSVQAGAIGYLLKDESPSKILDAIQIVIEGGAVMSPSIAAKSLKLLKSAEITKQESEVSESPLSKREIEVLLQLSEGENYNQIAAKMFVSPSTVRKHIENIYRKLQVHNKIQAVQLAKKQNLI